MAHRITGLTFIFIAAMLYCARYITAALLKHDGPNTPDWFAHINSNIIGGGYTTWNILALLVGIGYLIYAEMANNAQKATQDTESL